MFVFGSSPHKKVVLFNQQAIRLLPKALTVKYVASDVVFAVWVGYRFVFCLSTRQYCVYNIVGLVFCVSRAGA